MEEIGEIILASACKGEKLMGMERMKGGTREGAEERLDKGSLAPLWCRLWVRLLINHASSPGNV